MKIKLKNILFLHICIFIYSLTTIAAKVTSRYQFLSFPYIIGYVVMVLILGIYAIKFAIPDKAFDTLNYHLYVQENAFSDNVMYNFFPARWINTFSFPLGDRMHYFFRFFLA